MNFMQYRSSSAAFIYATTPIQAFDSDSGLSLDRKFWDEMLAFVTVIHPVEWAA